MALRKVIKSDKLPSNSSTRVFIEDKEIAIFRLKGGELMAIDEMCPHMEGSMSQGIVKEGCKDKCPYVECPLHHLDINLVNGKIIDGEKDVLEETAATEVNTYQVVEKDGWISVDI
jgi:nitrite reductase (NADH) small subunit